MMIDTYASVRAHQGSEPGSSALPAALHASAARNAVASVSSTAADQ